MANALLIIVHYCMSGALAMESLHRQVLPFLLRRLKHEVLNDLPPKIIQDYYCELSHLQVFKHFCACTCCKSTCNCRPSHLSSAAISQLILDIIITS